MSLWEERAARNEAIFRELNDQIEALDEQFGLDDRTPPQFVCECSDDACTERITLPLDVYESVRADPRHFVLRPGHESDFEEVVSRHPTYVVVEKTGRAGELAEQLDSRSG